MTSPESFGVNGDPCHRCRALGWVKREIRDWPEPCPLCLGTCVGPTIYRVAERIEENRTTLYRLRDSRVSAATAARLFAKLLAFVERTGAAL